MFHFFIGTKAQFIKTAPIMVEMKNRGLPFRYIDSGQHADLTRSLRKVFGIREPDVHLNQNTGNIVSIKAALRWYLKCQWKSHSDPDWLKKEVFPGGGICLIHGDTLSTLLGMRMASHAGLKIAHVEAGLRSFNLLNPFPEELIRIKCMNKSDLLFAPSNEAYINLQKMGLSKKAVKLGENTVVDAMRLVIDRNLSFQIPGKPFALATCHRLETIARKDRLKRVVDLLNRIAREMTVLFVMHQPTRKYLKRFGLAESLHSNIKKMNMLDYNEFVALQKAAGFVVTDGGSIQEECSYLDKPCLILRNVTERSNGLDKNAVLWNFDDSVAEGFLLNHRNGTPIDLSRFPHPSAEIVDALIGLEF